MGHCPPASRRGLRAGLGEDGMTTLQWKPPRGHADIAPSQLRRIENDGYLTIDAHWIIPALLRSVPIEGRVLEPAAGRGHLSLLNCGARGSMCVIRSVSLRGPAGSRHRNWRYPQIDNARRIRLGRHQFPIAISRSWRTFDQPRRP